MYNTNIRQLELDLDCEVLSDENIRLPDDQHLVVGVVGEF